MQRLLAVARRLWIVFRSQEPPLVFITAFPHIPVSVPNSLVMAVINVAVWAFKSKPLFILQHV